MVITISDLLKENIEHLRYRLHNCAMSKSLVDSKVIQLSRKLDAQIYVYQKFLSYQHLESMSL
ncbi:hypothetical protein JCM14036_27020 [Desulfotomaculum defluvii]